MKDASKKDLKLCIYKEMSLDQNFNFFETFKNDEVTSGITQYKLKAKEFFLKKSHPLCKYIDLDESILSSPFLLSIVSRKCPVHLLDQAILGRLILYKKHINDINVYADNYGIVYVPNIGYFKIGQIDAGREIKISCTNQGIQLKSKPNSAKHIEWIKEQKTYNNIVIHHLSNTFLECFSKDRNFDILDDRSIHSVINNALKIIQQIAPNYYEKLIIVTKGIIPFSSQYSNSFASTNAFGLVFINMLSSRSVIMMIEELAHQCGHLIYSTLTFNPELLFSKLPNLKISELINEKDNRTIYVLMHGLFTYSTIISCLSLVLDKRLPLTKIEIHETLGRLAFTARRFQYDLKLVSEISVLTPKGKEWIKNFYVCYKGFISRYISKLNYLNLEGQEYTFSYSIFEKKNPI